MPSIAPRPTSGALYYAIACSSAPARPASTTGYTYYVDPNANGAAFDASCAAGTATFPVWGAASGQSGVAIVLYESAVAIDATAPTSLPAGVTSNTSLSWTHTISGTNTALLVGVEVDAFSDGGITTTATFNGVAMTSLGRVEAAGSSHGYLQVFGLAGVATGAGTVAVTASGGTPDDMAGASLSFDNVNQTTPFGTAGTGNGTSTAPSAATASSTLGNLIAGFAASRLDLHVGRVPEHRQGHQQLPAHGRGRR